MLRQLSPGVLMAIGSILLVIGAVFPVLMMLHIMVSTYLLNLISFVSSMAGLVIGMYAVFEIHQSQKRGK